MDEEEDLKSEFWEAYRTGVLFDRSLFFAPFVFNIYLFNTLFPT